MNQNKPLSIFRGVSLRYDYQKPLVVEELRAKGFHPLVLVWREAEKFKWKNQYNVLTLGEFFSCQKPFPQNSLLVLDRIHLFWKNWEKREVRASFIKVSLVNLPMMALNLGLTTLPKPWLKEIENQFESIKWLELYMPPMQHKSISKKSFYKSIVRLWLKQESLVLIAQSITEKNIWLQRGRRFGALQGKHFNILIRDEILQTDLPKHVKFFVTHCPEYKGEILSRAYQFQADEIFFCLREKSCLRRLREFAICLATKGCSHVE